MLDKTFTWLQFCDTTANKDNPLFTAAVEEVKALRAMPEIVLLVGSARYKLAFERESERLTLEGAIVLGKHVYKPGEEWDLSEAHKDMIHAVQFRKADLAHRVHVVNMDSYIGKDTYNLIMYAIKRELPITFMEPFVKLLASDQSVTTHHFLQATTQRVKFEESTLG